MQGADLFDHPKDAVQLVPFPQDHHRPILNHHSAVLVHAAWIGWYYETPADEHHSSAPRVEHKDQSLDVPHDDTATGVHTLIGP